MRMDIGKKIGTGAQADVYEADNYAIKLFKPGYNKVEVFYEAAVTSLIEQTGLPIAKVHEVVRLNNQLAIKMDYIQGKCLNDLMQEDPTNFDYYMDVLVNLQIDIHSKSIPLPYTMAGRLNHQISSSGLIDDVQKAKLLSRLDAFPKGNQLCHGDFHGRNILKQGNDFFIIDWIDAANGHPDGDVCRTYMLYSLYRPDIAGNYLSLYCRKTGKNEKDILRWLPVIAAARLNEGFILERNQLTEWINNTNIQ